MSALFELPPVPLVPIVGEARAFPVGRIFCVGRNYEAHAKEMGFTADRETPIYFTKTPSAIVLSGSSIPYAPGTADLHYEIELVVAIGAPAFRIAPEEAMAAVYGYAGGLDMTRRDLQAAARDKGYPWDLGKDFEDAAVITPITPAAIFGAIGAQRITLRLDGELRQEATLAEFIWTIPELISHLSGFYHLRPGDLIYTGTPAGVGPVKPGNVLRGTIDGLGELTVTIGEAE